MRRRKDMDDWEGPRSPIKLSADGDPPTEFRLFPLGTIETTKGTFYLEAEDAQACLDAHAAYANDLSIDWGHGAFEEANGGPPQAAAGWIGGLEVRGDGLYAVRVTWTETAAGMLKRREQRYFSPAFTTDADGHVRSIINCALTLIPATHGLIPLVASRASNRGVAARKLSMKTKYLKAAALLALADEMDGEKASDGDKAMAARLRKLAEEGEELKLAEDDSDEPDGDEDPEKTSDGEPDGDEKKQASRIAKLARKLTGKHSPAEVHGVLLAYQQSGEQIAKLSKQVAELTRGNRSAEVADLVSKASRAGKLSPAQKTWATEYGMKDLAGFKAYLEAAPVLVSMRDGKPVETEQPDPASVPTTLSADQEKILKSAGVTDTKAYLAHQAKSALAEGNTQTMALSADRLTAMTAADTLPALLSIPVKGLAKIYAGSLVCINAGYAVPGSTATGLIAVGRAEEQADNSGSATDGAISVSVRPGVFKFAIGSTSITQAHVGLDCYVVDDQTVHQTDGSGTRSLAGRIVAVHSATECSVLVGLLGPALPASTVIQAGTTTLVAGTKTITGVTLTASSRIYVARNTPAGTMSDAGLDAPSASRNTGASTFVINAIDADKSTSVLDTSTVDWFVFG